MKFFLIAFAVIAAVAADVSHLPLNEYLPPAQEAVPVVIPTNEYLPPAHQFISTPVVAGPAPAPVPAPAHVLADDGYRYKTQRRVVYRRNRRDVSHLPLNEYLPPGQPEPVAAFVPTNEYLPPAQQFVPTPVVAGPAPAPAHVLADDGYRYKTQRRVVYRRNRRDVSHLPNYDYLPPTQEVVPIEVAPIQEVSNAVIEEPIAAHELADDGYRYKTQRRVVYRRSRRDVSHLPNYDYLPPAQAVAPVLDAPVQQEIAFVPESAPAHELADDGYRYKTQRRVVFRRNRRDVSHLVSNDYLPPVEQEFIPAAPPTNEYLAPQPIEPVLGNELSNDGYRYKTNRRVVYRRH